MVRRSTGRSRVLDFRLDALFIAAAGPIIKLRLCTSRHATRAGEGLLCMDCVAKLLAALRTRNNRIRSVGVLNQ